ncbi:MAG: allophanate hydrolase subunit 2 family protein, partial [Salinimicrobium sp.]
MAHSVGKKKLTMTEVEILQPGLFSSIQDQGRKGLMEFGVPKSGAMDSASARLANVLLRNPADAAVLEITQQGPKMAFLGPTKIAICGGLLEPAINGSLIENNKVYNIDEGDLLSFGKRQKGCRAYLAVKNGFQTEKVLGSRSWYDGITRHARLKKGMKLQYKPFEAEEFE